MKYEFEIKQSRIFALYGVLAGVSGVICSIYVGNYPAAAFAFGMLIEAGGILYLYKLFTTEFPR